MPTHTHTHPPTHPQGVVISEAGSSPSGRGYEYGWENIKTAFLRYKELHGNLSIPGSFVVPEGADGCWPAALAGMRLGAVLHGIRSGGHYKVGGWVLADTAMHCDTLTCTDMH